MSKKHPRHREINPHHKIFTNINKFQLMVHIKITNKTMNKNYTFQVLVYQYFLIYVH